MPGPRKMGSKLLAGSIGVALIALALVILIGGWSPDFHDSELRKWTNGGSTALFGIVLIWWAISEGAGWGIGFETVTMVIAVVTAAIAILTLTAGGTGG